MREIIPMFHQLPMFQGEIAKSSGAMASKTSPGPTLVACHRPTLQRDEAKRRKDLPESLEVGCKPTICGWFIVYTIDKMGIKSMNEWV